MVEREGGELRPGQGRRREMEGERDEKGREKRREMGVKKDVCRPTGCRVY